MQIKFGTSWNKKVVLKITIATVGQILLSVKFHFTTSRIAKIGYSHKFEILHRIMT